jgi:hypothetical protein
VLVLPKTVAAWQSAQFVPVLKRELSAQAAALPLQAGLRHTDRALTDEVQIVPLGAEARQAVLVVRVGVFFRGLQSGCGCADDPTPVEPQPEYCELELTIDRGTGETGVRLLEDASP